MQKRVGIFGGSFDPPHYGHLAIMESAIAQLGLHKLFIVPSFLNPFKNTFFFAPHLRLKWIQQLAKGLKGKGCEVMVVEFEVLQNAPTPTYKTLEFLKTHYIGDGAKIFLLLGADNVESLPKWAQFNALKNAVEFVIIPRCGYAIPKDFRRLEFKEIPLSSTEARERLINGDYTGLVSCIPAEILENIKEQYCKQIEKHSCKKFVKF